MPDRVNPDAWRYEGLQFVSRLASNAWLHRYNAYSVVFRGEAAWTAFFAKVVELLGWLGYRTEVEEVEGGRRLVVWYGDVERPSGRLMALDAEGFR